MDDLQEAADVYWLNSLEGGDACLLVDSYQDLADGIALAEALSLVEGYPASPPSCGGGTIRRADALRRALEGVEERRGRCDAVPPRLLQPTFSEKVCRGDAAACSDLIAFLRRLDELKSDSDRAEHSDTVVIRGSNVSPARKGHRGSDCSKTSSVGTQRRGSADRSKSRNTHTHDQVMFRKIPHTAIRSTATVGTTATPAQSRRSAYRAPREVIRRGGHDVPVEWSHSGSYAPRPKGAPSNVGFKPADSRPNTRSSENSVKGLARAPPPPPPPPPPPEPFPQAFSMQVARSQKMHRTTLAGTNRLGPRDRTDYDRVESATGSASVRPRLNATTASARTGGTGHVTGAGATARRAAAASAAPETTARRSMEAAPARWAGGMSDNVARPTSKRGTITPAGDDAAGAATARVIARMATGKVAHRTTPTNGLKVQGASGTKARACGEVRTDSQAIEPHCRGPASQARNVGNDNGTRAAGAARAVEAAGKRRTDRREVLRWMDSLGVKVDWSLLTPEGAPCHVRFSSGELLCELAAAVDYTTSGGRGLPLSEVPSRPGRFVLRGTCGAPANAARAKHNVRAAVSAFGALGGIRGTWLRSEQAILDGDHEATWGLVGDVYARYRRPRSARPPQSRQHHHKQERKPHNHHHHQQQQQHRQQQQQQHHVQQRQERPRQPRQRQEQHHEQRRTGGCPSSKVATRRPGRPNDRNNAHLSLEDTSKHIASRTKLSAGQAHPPRSAAHDDARMSPERHEHGFVQGLAVIPTITDTQMPPSERMRLEWAGSMAAPRSGSAETGRTPVPVPPSTAILSTETKLTKEARGAESAPSRTAPTIVSAPSVDGGGTLAPGVIAGAAVGSGDDEGDSVVAGVVLEAAATVVVAGRVVSASTDEASGNTPSGRTGDQLSSSSGSCSRRASPVSGAIASTATGGPEGTQPRDLDDRGVAALSTHAEEVAGSTLSRVADATPIKRDPDETADPARKSASTRRDSDGVVFRRSRQAGEIASAETSSWVRWDPSSYGEGTAGYVWGGSPTLPDDGSFSRGACCRDGTVTSHGSEDDRVKGAVSTRAAPRKLESNRSYGGRLRSVPERPTTLCDDGDEVCRRSATMRSETAAPIDGERKGATLVTSHPRFMPCDGVSFVRTKPRQVREDDASFENLDDVGAFREWCLLGSQRPLFPEYSGLDGDFDTRLGSLGLCDNVAPVVCASVPLPPDPFARSLTSDLLPLAHHFTALSSA